MAPTPPISFTSPAPVAPITCPGIISSRPMTRPPTEARDRDAADARGREPDPTPAIAAVSTFGIRRDRISMIVAASAPAARATNAARYLLRQWRSRTRSIIVLPTAVTAPSAMTAISAASSPYSRRSWPSSDRRTPATFSACHGYLRLHRDCSSVGRKCGEAVAAGRAPSRDDYAAALKAWRRW